MVQLDIEVIEIVSHADILGIGVSDCTVERKCGVEHDVGVSAAGRYVDGGLVLDDGTFQIYLGGDEPGGDIAVPVLQVTVLHADIYHR